MKRSMFLLVILAFGLTAVPAFADIWTIDISQGDGSGGTIVADGSGGFIGTNIAVGTMTVWDGSNEVGFYDLSGSGTVVGSDANGAAVVNFDTATGAFTIIGDVEGLSGFTGSATLINGTGTAVTASSTTDGITLVYILELDEKDTALLTALGIPADEQWQLMYATFEFTTVGGVVKSIDIYNVSVPDGGVTLMLLGGALVGLETLRRRLRA